MALSRRMKKIMDIALARKERYKKLMLSDLGLECVALSEYTTAGGASSEEVSISGVKAGDFALVTLSDEGSNLVTIKYAKAGADKVDVEFSADPGNDAKAVIAVFRSLASESIY